MARIKPNVTLDSQSSEDDLTEDIKVPIPNAIAEDIEKDSEKDIKAKVKEVEFIEPKFFQVLKPATVLIAGFRQNIPQGKVLSSQHYDIGKLKRSGVVLKEVGTEAG